MLHDVPNPCSTHILVKISACFLRYLACFFMFFFTPVYSTEKNSGFLIVGILALFNRNIPKVENIGFIQAVFKKIPGLTHKHKGAVEVKGNCGMECICGKKKISGVWIWPRVKACHRGWHWSVVRNCPTQSKLSHKAHHQRLILAPCSSKEPLPLLKSPIACISFTTSYIHLIVKNLDPYP